MNEISEKGSLFVDLLGFSHFKHPLFVNLSGKVTEAGENGNAGPYIS
jgi:hypothetical protein